jgi:hypothetical protein
MQFSPLSDSLSAFLPYVKAHLRLGDGNDEDTALTLYSCAAFEYIRQFLRQDWPEDPLTAQPEWIAAALMIVADLYENREAQGEIRLSENKTVERLLWLHRLF